MLTATSLPITCAHSMVSASAWVGLTLPGMIELPGSFSGMRSSPRPERGPEASRRMSLAIFEQRRGERLQRAVREHAAPRARRAPRTCSAPARTAGRSRRASIRADPRARSRGCVLSPVPTAVPPIASSYSAGSAALQRRQRMLELRHVAGELLAERERRRVLQVRAPDLDDAVERVAFASSVVAQRSSAGSTSSSQRARRGDVHRGREHVVRRLAEVDVVVRMHQALLRRARRRAARRRGWRAPR